MQIGNKVVVKSKNAKAAGKLSEHKCPTWSIIDVQEEVSFSERPGPWIKISPNNGKTNDPFCLVVHATQDLNYEVIAA